MSKIIVTAVRIITISVLLFIIATSAKELLEYNKGKEDSRAMRGRVVAPAQASELSGVLPITVDFDALAKENADTVGWLYCENTPINYPVVQGKDNCFYLRRGYDKKYLYSGTLFVDYRMSGKLADKNTVIYGHNMKNAEMFGTLINYKSQEYFSAHPVMFWLSPEKNYKIDLIAGIEVPGTSELFGVLTDYEQTEKIITDALKSSTFCSGYTYADGDRFITLSTCSYDYADARYIVFGKLNEIL